MLHQRLLRLYQIKSMLEKSIDHPPDDIRHQNYTDIKRLYIRGCVMN